MNLIISPKTFSGIIDNIPGDKSITHRAIILAAISEGRCVLKNISISEDCMTTLNTINSLGVKTELDGNNLIIYGKGKFLEKDNIDLDLKNSGTSIRLLTGLISGLNIEAKLFGDKSLNKRPMQRITDPLSKMGANIVSNGTPPIKIKKNNGLKGIEYYQNIPSSQVKSSILLAGIYANSDTTVIEDIKTRDHLERILKHCKYPIEVRENKITIKNSKISPFDLIIGGDISSAIFIIVATIISKNSNITLKNININTYRNGSIKILKKMGAKIDVKNIRVISNETIADIQVCSSELKGLELNDKSLTVSSIDEFPALFIAAACAKGKSKFYNLSELRVKESDRLNAMAKGLIKLGVQVKVEGDVLEIEGQEKFKPAKIKTYDDHRIAMAFSIASCKSKIIIDNSDIVKISFPNFWEILKSLGFKNKKQAAFEANFFD